MSKLSRFLPLNRGVHFAAASAGATALKIVAASKAHPKRVIKAPSRILHRLRDDDWPAVCGSTASRQAANAGRVLPSKPSIHPCTQVFCENKRPMTVFHCAQVLVFDPRYVMASSAVA